MHALDPPRAVMVGPHIYDVRTSAALVRDMRADGEHGRCRPAELTIDLDPEHPLTVVAETLLHEIVHACLSGAGVSAALAEIDDALEERIVLAVSPLLLDVLRSNPELVTFLTGPPDGPR